MAAVGAGLLTPRAVLAAWPTDAFKATTVDAALDALNGSHATESSDKVQIDAPDLAGLLHSKTWNWLPTFLYTWLLASLCHHVQ